MSLKTSPLELVSEKRIRQLMSWARDKRMLELLEEEIWVVPFRKDLEQLAEVMCLPWVLELALERLAAVMCLLWTLV